MRALSLHQPWAWALIHGGKDVENRSWPTRFRGPLLIHATKRFRPAEIEEALEAMAPFVKGPLPSLDEIRKTTGGIIGRVEVVGCVTESESPWFFGPYGFVVDNPEPLPFHACPGARGLWYASFGDAAAERALEERLRRST